MLQPRIPLRRICFQCQSLSSNLRRTYATQVIDPVAPSRSTDPTQPQMGYQSANNALQTKGPETAMRKYTPRTPGLRHLIRPRNDHLWKGKPHRPLTFPKKGHAKGGRNRTGRITVRHRGGGHKRRIRTVDFHRNEPGQHQVMRIEHDPNRSAHIALVKSVQSGKLSYILAAEGQRAGDIVTSYRAGLPEELLGVDMGMIASKTAYRGNCLKLGMIPVGTPIFNIAPKRVDGGKFARSAGTHGILIGKGEDTVQREMIRAIGDNKSLDLAALTPEQLARFEKAAGYVTVKLTSGEVRMIDKEAVATIGVASNATHKDAQLGKAGRKRWLGIRPTVRGTAMNTNDHPHGGGRGKSKGNKIPVSPWGVPVSHFKPLLQVSSANSNRPNQATRHVQRTRSTPWSSRVDHVTMAREGRIQIRIAVVYEPFLSVTWSTRAGLMRETQNIEQGYDFNIYIHLFKHYNKGCMILLTRSCWFSCRNCILGLDMYSQIVLDSICTTSTNSCTRHRASCMNEIKQYFLLVHQ